MQKIKVYIEQSSYGYSAYMEDNKLDYACMGEGKTVKETMTDFLDSYNEIKEYYRKEGLPFEEVEWEYYYDTASFLDDYCRAFSLAGLERITGVSQTQLGHYLHGRRRPSSKTVERIQRGVQEFAGALAAIHFMV